MNESHRILITDLLVKIFEAETRNFQNQVNKLIDENDQLLGCRTEGFNHNGNNYGRNSQTVVNCRALNLNLVPQMNRLLQLQKAVEFDKQIIRQALVKLLQPCQTTQDTRDVLPECVLSLISWIPQMYSRTREPAWSIQESPRDLRQYQKALAKMEFYCATRLLY